MTVKPIEVVFTEGKEDKATLVARLINAIAKASKWKTAKEVQKALQEGVLNIWREVPQGSRPARGHLVCIRVKNDDALQRLINLKASLGDDKLTMAQAFPRYAWRLSTWLRAREVAFRKYHQEQKMKGYKARVGLDEDTYLPVLKLTYPDERRPIIYTNNDLEDSPRRERKDQRVPGLSPRQGNAGRKLTEVFLCVRTITKVTKLL